MYRASLKATVSEMLGIQCRHTLSGFPSDCFRTEEKRKGPAVQTQSSFWEKQTRITVERVVGRGRQSCLPKVNCAGASGVVQRPRTGIPGTLKNIRNTIPGWARRSV